MSHNNYEKHTCSLDKNVVELVLALSQASQNSDEIATDSAADTAIVHFKNFFVGVNIHIHQGVVDAHLSELVFNDGNALSVVLIQDVVKQRGLAGTKKTSEDADGDFNFILVICHI